MKELLINDQKMWQNSRKDYMTTAVPNKPQKIIRGNGKGKGKGRPVTSYASTEGK
jgi:hypothetical protein